ncbi:MAG: RNA-guided endonuclease TnpB family protein [Caldilineaceae bacterium]
MIRAHKIRLNPDAEQEVYFKKAAGTARFVFNWGLARWKEAKAQGVKEYGVMALKKEFNGLKEEQFLWVYDVTKSVCEAAFVNLGKALKNYFDSKSGKRQGEKMGFPKFKKKRKAKQSFGLANDRFKVDGHSVKIEKLGLVNMAEALRFQGKIMGAVVSCVAGKWYISIQVEIEQPEPLRFEQRSTGVDLGVKTLATLSNGDEFENQKLLRRELNQLKKLNRSLSRRKEQSNRWYKAKDKLARFHERVKNRRADAIHKMTTTIAKTYQLVGVEDLHVKGMVRNRKLALSIADASMGEVLRQLEYKSAAFGGRIVKVGRFYASSKTCSDCGHINKPLTLADRKWTCQGCGTIHERDWNAAKNIEQEALRWACA